jgi:hypothetical protein
MRVSVDLSELKKIKWSEYAVRFVFGGAITALTGVLAALRTRVRRTVSYLPGDFPGEHNIDRKA